MAGTWERVGDGHYILALEIAVEVYRWHAPAPDGSCVVEFQAPKEFPYRRFYPVEVLRALDRGEPADDYVEKMCRPGIDLLPELETVLQQVIKGAPDGDEAYDGKQLATPEILKFLLAIFESRRGGHQRVTRDFHREDDFYATEGSRKGDFLVPGVNPPRWYSKTRIKGQDVINYVARTLAGDPTLPSNKAERELPLSLSPMRTPLDQLLVEGIFRNEDAAKTPTINEIAKKIAPSLIDGIELDDDSRFLGEYRDDFCYFLRRLANKYFKEPAEFCRWLRQEREKGFVRLLRDSKRFTPTDRENARIKATRFYRRVLWTSYEAMSRCFGATALHMWMSFCQSDVVCPSRDEQRAFRFYNAPLVLAAGLPLWFFGPNVLAWVMEGLIDRVWGWADGQDFDVLTCLIALYGETARKRRTLDANKKRMKQVANHRPDLLAGAQDVQYEETRDGQTVATPTPTVMPMDVFVDAETDYPDLPPDGKCPSCGGRLIPVGKPELTPTLILVDTECPGCGLEQVYRRQRPE